MSEERLSLTLDARRTAIVVIDLQEGIVRMPGAPSPRPTVVANARAGRKEPSANRSRFPESPSAGVGGNSFCERRKLADRSARGR